MDSNDVVKKILEDYKERVLFAIEYEPPAKNKEIGQMLEELLVYSVLPEIDLEKLKQQFSEEIKNNKHLVVLISDFDIENVKEKLKLKAEIYNKVVDFIKKNNIPVWLHVLLMEDIKQISMDSKFEIFDSFLAAKVIYDKGMYEIFKLTLVHKNLVLDTFKKYVVCYVLAGSYVKGRNVETSDVDIYVVIDDTDVKLHTFIELKQKLYSIITQKAMEAMLLTQSKKILHPQVYTLTEFWMAMSEANPVIITFLRDGIAIYDRGTFIAWKNLLLKGEIKPSKEAAEKYLKIAENTLNEVENKLKIILMEDLALSMLTSAQAVIMDYGLLPPDPKEAPFYLKKLFVEEKKLLEPKYYEYLDKIIKIRKDIEHKRKDKVEGKEIDEWLNIARDFLNRMKRLKTQIDIEKEKEEISYYIQEFYVALTELENLYNKKADEIFKEKYKSELNILKELLDGIKSYREGKLDTIDINKLKSNLQQMIRFIRKLIEEKKMEIITKNIIEVIADKKYDVYLTEDYIFVISDDIKKYNYLGELLDKYDRSQFENIVLKEIKSKGKKIIDRKTIEAFNKIFGDYKIIF